MGTKNLNTKYFYLNTILMTLCLFTQACSNTGFKNIEEVQAPAATASATNGVSATTSSQSSTTTLRQPANITTNQPVAVSQPVISNQPVVAGIPPSNSVCSNGASDSPSCLVCPPNYHMESGKCIFNSRTCTLQPVGAFGGSQTWTSDSGWSSCQNFSCSADYFMDSASNTCIKGCRSQPVRWFVDRIGSPMNSCVSMAGNLREGESARLISQKSPRDSNGWYTPDGYIDVKCENSQLKYPSGHFQNGDTAPSFEAYLNSLFRHDPLHIECNSETANFAPARSWESCRTASTATCFAALGSQPTTTNACWAINIYMDAGLTGQTSIGNLADLFNTTYQVFIKTSKDGFASRIDITDAILAGYGKPLTNAGAPGYGQPYNSQGRGEPAGFSVVARKDMEGQSFKVIVQATTHLAGAIRQQNESEALIQVRENSACSANYDGAGVANFVIGAGTDGKTVRVGYPFPLHYD